ncbi:MAG: acyltransferase [Deltaproteobacteria bacterium]|nr:acyltransferase [Deltaproteobacteria bacterium]
MTIFLQNKWTRFWMRQAGMNLWGRLATRLATWFSQPYKSRVSLSYMNPKGYIALSAEINHANLKLGANIFVGDRCVIHQVHSGSVELGGKVQLYSDIIIETGNGGKIIIGDDTHIQPRCQLIAYVGSLQIGKRVEIAPNCFFYPYNHGIDLGESIRKQPAYTKGGIIIGNDSWLGVGVIVLDGVRIGKGAVIGAGSVVTTNIPDYAVAYGNPAQVVRLRNN